MLLNLDLNAENVFLLIIDHFEESVTMSLNQVDETRDWKEKFEVIWNGFKATLERHFNHD